MTCTPASKIEGRSQEAACLLGASVVPFCIAGYNLHAAHAAQAQAAVALASAPQALASALLRKISVPR